MEDLNNIILKIHSYESGGTVDGPGIRFVVFMQGCPLRCQYCHNPDTWDANLGKKIPASDLVNEVIKYKKFMEFSKGGVTFSGGEPLVQKEKLLPVIKALKLHNIHIAIDTAGTTNIDETTTSLLKYVDLVMLDVKHLVPYEHKLLTGLTNEKTIAFLELLNKQNIRTWVRWVVVPGINDSKEYAHKFADFIKEHSNVELVEILPYHKNGIYKWKELKLTYPLENINEPTKESIEDISKILEQKGIKTLYAH